MGFMRLVMRRWWSGKCVQQGGLVLVSTILALTVSGCLFQSDLVLDGRVQSTNINICAEVNGKVVEVPHEEGDVVKKGAILVKVDQSDDKLKYEQQALIVRQQEVKLNEIKAGTRYEEIQKTQAAVKIAQAKLDEIKNNSIEEQIKQQEITVKSCQNDLDYWAAKYKRDQTLFQKGAISKAELTETDYKLNSVQQELNGALIKLDEIKKRPVAQSVEAAQAEYDQARAQLAMVKNGATIYTLKTAEQAYEQAKISLAQVKLSLDKYLIRTPISGTFISRNVNIGDTLSEGTAVGCVSDLCKLWVRVFVPQKHLKYVTLNQELELKSVSLPGRKFRGRISYIASQAEFIPQNIDKDEAEENTVYEMKITLSKKIKGLRPGMTADVHIPR